METDVTMIRYAIATSCPLSTSDPMLLNNKIRVLRISLEIGSEWAQNTHEIFEKYTAEELAIFSGVQRFLSRKSITFFHTRYRSNLLIVSCCSFHFHRSRWIYPIR